MNKLYIFLVVALLQAARAQAQGCDYITQQFTITTDSNLVYGTDTSYNGNPIDLHMDISYPTATPNGNRPMIVWVYGGAWVAGSKEDMIQWRRRFAARGYIAVAIQYRLGFFNDLIVPYIGNIPRPYGPEEPYRASFRAQQDLKGALRFLYTKKDIYHLDTNQVYIGGQSAGAITCLTAAFLNHDSLKNNALKNISDYYNPGTGMRIKRPDLGSANGRLWAGVLDLKIKGIVNMFGAIPDTGWIRDPNGPAVFSYHQSIDYNNEDPVVSSYTKIYFWSLGLNYPWGMGSRMIDARLQHLGYDSCRRFTYIYPGITHGLHDEAQVDLGIAQLLNRLVCHEPCFPLGLQQPMPTETFYIYPLPATSEVYFSESVQGVLINLAGVAVRAISGAQADLTSLPAGLYILKGTTTSGMLLLRKLVVE